MLILKPIHRRKFLRGVLNGAAVTVGLPLLDCFLNDSGTALANGVPLPIRFGTWFWGLGMNETIWIPDKVGADYDLKPELAAIAPVKQHVNLFTRYRTNSNGRPDFVHYSGAVMLRCGQAPITMDSPPNESLDTAIASAIGDTSRFPSLEISSGGKVTFSFQGPNAINMSETSPLNLYRTIFGAGYQDPNSPIFTPNPQFMLRKSVLSAVREDSKTLNKIVSAADRQRLEQHFTALRGLEKRLDLQLKKAPPAAACHAPSAVPPNLPVGMDVDLVGERHALMTDILVMAMACDQTRVFNMAYAFADTTKSGEARTHHILTHEETRNMQSVQELHSWFVRRAMAAWAQFVTAFASLREGDGTLLDNTLIFAHSEHSDAASHSNQGIPMMTAGRAGGRVKSGLHVDGADKRMATEVGLTMMRAMGLNSRSWGSGAMRTDRTVSEILT